VLKGMEPDVETLLRRQEMLPGREANFVEENGEFPPCFD
jgi:hypothetical protein